MSSATLLAPAAPCVPARAADEACPAQTPPRGATHRYWIDWMRFLAAALVMVEHVCSHDHLAWEDLPATSRTAWRFVLLFPTRLGRESVLLFFVISGFLVGGATIRRVREGTFDPGAYALDRITRIYVPLLPALGLTMAVSAACGLPIFPTQYLYHMMGLQGVCVNVLWLNTPLWTLTYETWFYVLAGTAAVLAAPGTRGRILAYTFAALSLALFVELEFTFLFCWLLGALAYGLTDAVRTRRASLGWTAAAVAVAASAGYQAANGLGPKDPAWQASMPGVRMCELVLAAAAAVLVACLAGAVPGSRLGDRIERAGSRLAVFSYTLYLVHYPVMCYLERCWPRLGGGGVRRAGVWIVLCTVASAGMYACFEAQTPRVRAWLRGRLAAAGR